MPVRMSPERFAELVGDALDLIPPALAQAIDNVVILVADRDPLDKRPEDEALRHGGEDGSGGEGEGP